MTEAAVPGGDAVPRWGVVHVHTSFSDGGIDMPAVIAAAQSAELDFVIITDHNSIEARSYQGYHDELLVVVDVEITPSDIRNHLLALGLPDYDSLHRLKEPARYVDAVLDAGGFAWVPHPCGFRNLWCGVYNAPWKLWDHRIAGIEIGTFLVEWVEGLRPWNLRARLRDPARGVGDPNPRVLRLWDRLNSVRPVAGFIGIDAHYREKLGGRLHTPTYEFLFRTHNLLAWTPARTGDVDLDVAALHDALRAGRFANVFGHVAERGEVRFSALADGLRVLSPPCGDTTIHLVRDGRPASIKHGHQATFQGLDAGVYRAEVYRRGRLWALTNPVTWPAVGRPRRALTPDRESAQATP